jgi:hypothetical protein
MTFILPLSTAAVQKLTTLCSLDHKVPFQGFRDLNFVFIGSKINYCFIDLIKGFKCVVYLNKYPNYQIYRALRLCGGMESAESEALYVVLLHEISARVVIVPK